MPSLDAGGDGIVRAGRRRRWHDDRYETERVARPSVLDDPRLAMVTSRRGIHIGRRRGHLKCHARGCRRLRITSRRKTCEEQHDKKPEPDCHVGVLTDRLRLVDGRSGANFRVSSSARPSSGDRKTGREWPYTAHLRYAVAPADGSLVGHQKSMSGTRPTTATDRLSTEELQGEPL